MKITRIFLYSFLAASSVAASEDVNKEVPVAAQEVKKPASYLPRLAHLKQPRPVVDFPNQKEPERDAAPVCVPGQQFLDIRAKDKSGTLPESSYGSLQSGSWGVGGAYLSTAEDDARRERAEANDTFWKAEEKRREESERKALEAKCTDVVAAAPHAPAVLLVANEPTE